jgi:DNA-binding transcriptional ArsR family regulator
MSLDRVTSPTERMVEVFRALGDPIRADVMSRIITSDEVACTSLEETLTISKSTISYHMKILYRAGLIDIRKSGRNYFYSARREAIEASLPGLLAWLTPEQSGKKRRSSTRGVA